MTSGSWELVPPSVSQITIVDRKGTYTEVHLKRVVDEPLERGKRTNHEDTNWQSVPQTTEADLAVDASDGLARALASLAVAVELRDHDICMSC